jgi:hypothetical protein
MRHAGALGGCDQSQALPEFGIRAIIGAQDRKHSRDAFQRGHQGLGVIEIALHQFGAQRLQ